MDVALDIKCIVETNLITVSFHCISCSFHFNSYLKQLYISNKMEHFSYKSGCGMTHIEVFKNELVWAIVKRLQFISNIMLVTYITKKLKNRAILNIKHYCTHCCMVLSNYFKAVCKFMVHWTTSDLLRKLDLLKELRYVHI